MENVLFVCNHNAGRSQMAQAFFEALAPPDLHAEAIRDLVKARVQELLARRLDALSPST